MTLVARAMRVHARRLSQAAGISVRYSRGSQMWTVTAIPARSDFEDAGGEANAQILTKSPDWLIEPAELRLPGTNQQIEPAMGDVVEVNWPVDSTIAADTDVYDVLPTVAGKAWEWSDVYRTMYRIHTVRRGTSS